MLLFSSYGLVALGDKDLVVLLLACPALTVVLPCIFGGSSSVSTFPSWCLSGLIGLLRSLLVRTLGGVSGLWAVLVLSFLGLLWKASLTLQPES